MTIITHKIRIYPSKRVRDKFTANFGYYRYAFNKSLELYKKLLDKGEKNLTDAKIKKLYLAEVREPWEKEYASSILENAIKDMVRGWKSYYNKITSKSPKFKSRKKSKESFRVHEKAGKDRNPGLRIVNNRLYYPTMKQNDDPKLDDGIRLGYPLRFQGRIAQITFMKQAGKYYASIAIDTEEDLSVRFQPTGRKVGIDANLGHFDISEDNHRFDSPIFTLKKYYAKISHYQRMMSRKKYKSLNYEKVRIKLQRVYQRISNIQNDWLHKFTTQMVRDYDELVIEDLQVASMISRFNKVNQALYRSLFYRFRVFLEYKTELYGKKLIKASKQYPSTQRCSNCGHVKTGNCKLKITDRIYNCQECGTKLDRDKNSAYNLKRMPMGWATS